MAKKQIKELVVRVSSRGGDVVSKELISISNAITSATAGTRAMNKEIGGSVKVVANIAKEYHKVAESVNAATKSFRSFNNAMNGDTKAAEKKIQSYVDNLEILNLFLKDTATQAKLASTGLTSVVGAGAITQLDTLVNFLEQAYLELVDLNSGLDRLNDTSIETVNTLDKLADRITDVEVQTKKNRIQTERAAQVFEGYSGAIRGSTVAKERATQSTDKLNNSTRRLSGTGSQSARAFSDLAFKMNPLVSLYASIAVNVYALSEAFRILNEASNLGRLFDQTATFAASLSGINVRSLSLELVELSDNAISAGDALRQTVRGVSYGFTVDELERLTVGAKKASIALGVDFTDAIDRAFRGIAKQEVELLDEIGVVTRLDTAFRNYAANLGLNADKLTDVQRRAALATEVISQLEKRFSGIVASSTGFEELSAAIKNTLDFTLMSLSKNLDGLTRRIANTLKGFQGLRSGAVTLAEAQETYNAAIRQNNMSQAAVAYDEMQKAMKQIRLEATEGTEEYKEYQDSLKNVKTAQYGLNVAFSAGALLAAKYAVVMASQLTVAVYSAIVAMVRFNLLSKVGTAALATKAVVVGTVTTVLAIYRTTLSLTTTAQLAFALAMSAIATPAVLLGAKILLITAAVAALTAGFMWFVDKVFGVDVFGWLTDKLGVFWEAIKRVLKSIGIASKELAQGGLSKVADGLESIAKFSGIDDLTGSFLGLTEQANEAADKLKLVDEYMKSINLRGGAILYRDPIMDRKSAEDNLAYMGSAGDAVSKISTAVKEMTEYNSPLQDMLGGISTLAAIPVNLKLDPDRFKEAETRFLNLQDRGIIPITVKWDDGRGLVEFGKLLDSAAAKVREYEQNGDFNLELRILREIQIGDPFADLVGAKLEMQSLNSALAAYVGLGENVNKREREQLAQKKSILAEEIRILEVLKKSEALSESYAKKEELSLSVLSMQTDYESKKLDLKIRMLESLMVEQAALGVNTEELRKQLGLLKQQKDVAVAQEQIMFQNFGRYAKEQELQRKLNVAGNDKSRVAIQKEILAVEQQKVNAMAEGESKLKAMYDLEVKRQQLSLDAKAAPFSDLSTLAGNMSQLPGLTDMQGSFLTAVEGMSSTWESFQSQLADGSKSFASFLQGDLQAFADVAQGLLGFAQNVYSVMSQAKVDSIDREIEAEKRRDGKSAESMSKIKALEAKRIKEEAKAKKASIIMSTATAVMQGFAQGGPIIGALLAAPTIAMGMFQLGQIDKATSGQLAGLNGGGSNLSIEGGNRRNEVDVSRSSNAGELSYLAGQAGMGNANNFTPGRAGGNFASAGTSITVGESGPEVITPAIPVNVSRAGQPSSSGSITFAPVYQISTIDMQGAEQFMDKHSRLAYDALEKELRARNLTLENL